MNELKEWTRPDRPLLLAAVSCVVLIAGAFLAAALTASDTGLFALAPEGIQDPRGRDVIPADRTYVFHATFYTVWATMLLSLPAFCTVWFTRRSDTAAGYWLAFWTAGLVGMLVHLYMAIGVLFEWDWQHTLSTTQRVTIPVPSSSRSGGALMSRWAGP